LSNVRIDRQFQPGALDRAAALELIRGHVNTGLVEAPERGLEAVARHRLPQVGERDAGTLQQRPVRAARVGVDGALHQKQKRPLALPQAPRDRRCGLLAGEAVAQKTVAGPS
jgi:hypothetical protein